MKYTREELNWARRQCKKVGLKDPRTLLEMHWSDLSRLLAEHNLKLVITDEPAVKVRKKR